MNILCNRQNNPGGPDDQKRAAAATGTDPQAYFHALYPLGLPAHLSDQSTVEPPHAHVKRKKNTAVKVTQDLGGAE